MVLTDMKIGVMPYGDGSGYRYEVSIREGIVSVVEGGSSISLKRDECKAVMDAIDELWAAQDKIT